MELEKQKSLLPADIHHKDLVPLTGHPLKIASETPGLSPLQLNQLFSNEFHFIMNL